jgi:alpha-galactosidase
MQVGEIPAGIAALLTRRIGVIDLTVEAALRGDPALFVEAVLADGAVTDPPQATRMVDELLLAQDPFVVSKEGELGTGDARRRIGVS